MRLSAQNLTDGKKPLLAHGRGWLWFGTGARHRHIGLEWTHTLRPRRVGLALTVSDEGETVVCLGLLFACYFLAFPTWGRPAREFDGRRTGIMLSFPEWWFTIAWRNEGDDCGHGRTGWKWQAELPDVFLGRAAYREGEPATYRIVVRMPERDYFGTAVIRDDSWKRPLWFRRTIRRAHIDMDEGNAVPVPGKGENSWDIDDDAIYGMTCPARTPDEAADAVREGAMRTRGRYASYNWTPNAA